jgi:hypothetical protein
MSKLDINALLNNSLARKSEAAIQESNLNLNLEGVTGGAEGGCPGCPGSSLNLNLEAVAHQELLDNYIGEDVITNIRAAIGAGLGVKTVLEARHA